MKYKTTAKLVIQACDKDLPGVFGHGCVLLLQGIAREHSLNRAAKSMGMASVSYTHLTLPTICSV